MPSLNTFRIEFDRPGSTYSPGESVTGRVIIDLSKGKNVRGVKALIKGEARVTWTTQRTETDSRGHKHTKTDHHTDSENYFELMYYLLGRATGNADIYLPEGHSEYPFDFQLPRNIPCSFEHKIGHIRYTIKAIIDRPWKFDHECKTAFSVVTPLDLNTVSHECVGIDDEVRKNYYLCCCDRGSMNVRIKVPSSGYVSGQTINANLYLDVNSTKVEVTRVSVKLEREVVFHIRTAGTKSDSHVVKKDEKKGPFEKKEDVLLQLLVPPLPPSKLDYCSLIDLKYRLHVTIHVSGVHCKTQEHYPVLIGTIPLRTTNLGPRGPFFDTNTYPTAPSMHQIQTPMPMPMPMPTPTVGPSPMTAPYPLTGNLPGTFNDSRQQPGQAIGFAVSSRPSSSIQWDMPPPSYEECMPKTQSIKDDDESNYVHGANEPFSPRYPVFNYPVSHLPRK